MARKISMKQAINEALDQEMARDPSVIVMGEDIVGGAGGNGERDAWGGVLGVTKGLYAKHGERRRRVAMARRRTRRPPARGALAQCARTFGAAFVPAARAAGRGVP